MKKKKNISILYLEINWFEYYFNSIFLGLYIVLKCNYSDKTQTVYFLNYPLLNWRGGTENNPD